MLPWFLVAAGIGAPIFAAWCVFLLWRAIAADRAAGKEPAGRGLGSLPAAVRPLPGRRNIVVSRNGGYTAQGAEVVTELPESGDLWVIGGAQLYGLALPLAERCEITEIDIDLHRDDGDAMAPVLDESWVGTEGDWLTSGSGLRYRFSSYVRT